MRKQCDWCYKSVEENELEEAGGCDIIPKGFMVCDECINIRKAYIQNNNDEEEANQEINELEA